MRKHFFLLIAIAILLSGVDEAAESGIRKNSSDVSTVLQLELNAFEQRQRASRPSLVATNGMQRKLANHGFELVVFEPGGKVSELLSASFGTDIARA